MKQELVNFVEPSNTLITKWRTQR